MKTQLIHYIRAGYAGLFLVSHEEQRVEAELKSVATELGQGLWAWSSTTGLVETDTGRVRDCLDPLEVLNALPLLEENTVILLRDFHLYLEEANALLVRKLKEQILECRTNGKTIIVLGCRRTLPPELEREFTVLDYALPGTEELSIVLAGVAESANCGSLATDIESGLIDAARGMTTTEAANAFALSIVETGRLQSSVITREKAQAVKRNGLLEVIHTPETLESIGGLEHLKAWLLRRKNCFSKSAAAYGLPAPKGLLILGIPGTGKSLSAKATAKVFDLPLLKFDAGRIFAGLVGQSESNLRSVIQTAEAIAPCVLWIDEIEKGFAGSKSSGATDGGTSSRVFGTFISWMQEKRSPVFVVATANDVSQLPPEMLRKGRWDELFFVDLPTREERESIWAIQINKYGRDPRNFDIPQLAKSTEGLTGSEIEQVFVEALHLAFDQETEPSDYILGEVLVDFVPLSKLMAEQIEGLRQWSQGRARPASVVPTEKKLRRIA